MAHAARGSKGWKVVGGSLAAAGLALAGLSPAAANGGPSLGAARGFGVLAGSNVASTGLTEVTGDVGTSPGTSITGFGPGIVIGGALHAGDALAAEAHADASIAYAFLAGMSSPGANNLSDVDMGGLTLAPGVYVFDTSAAITGALTLDAGGDADALFVFRIGSTLTTASGASVVVVNGGGNHDASRIFWQVGSSATLGSGTSFTGNILAYASVSLVSGTTMEGNAIGLNGAVTLESAIVTSPVFVPDGRPTGGKIDMTAPDEGPDADARARIFVKHFPAKAARPDRSWLKIKGRHLDRKATYTLWIDDPSTEAADLLLVDTFETKQGGNVNYTLDTKKGAALPFGATLAALGGMAVEIRDAAGTTTVLEGTIPRANH